MSETAGKKPGFPIGLTVATAIAFAILCGLGTWQVQRLHWKEGILARIEKLKTAPARPLIAVFRDTPPADREWVRVRAQCASRDLEVLEPRYAIRDGKIAWRAMVACRPVSDPSQVVAIDRGYIDAASEAMAAPRYRGSAPDQVVGVLRRVPETQELAPQTVDGQAVHSSVTMLRSPTWMIVAESETPAPAGITPAPLPVEISNRHLEYALTWFGLAVTLLFIYAAMLWRRLRP